tara:strand:- start:695 stop:1372 length:678 start_codon:yes stop_codon:yes gene_type:complete
MAEHNMDFNQNDSVFHDENQVNYMNDSDYENDQNENETHDHENNVVPRKRINFAPLPSNSHAQYIVHAETNAVYPFKPGTFESLELYNVVGLDGNSYYYNSPEEYYLHRGIEKNMKHINDWHSQKNEIFSSPKNQFNRKQYDELKKTLFNKRNKQNEENRQKSIEQTNKQNERIAYLRKLKNSTEKSKRYKINGKYVINKHPRNNSLCLSNMIIRDMHHNPQFYQ